MHSRLECLGTAESTCQQALYVMGDLQIAKTQPTVLTLQPQRQSSCLQGSGEWLPSFCSHVHYCELYLLFQWTPGCFFLLLILPEDKQPPLA
jgi:hypothetical protein